MTEQLMEASEDIGVIRGIQAIAEYLGLSFT